MIPASPWASVSWISPASRCRSSWAPDSRAWTTSWACSPAFSCRAASSRPTSSSRLRSSGSLRAVSRMPTPIAAVCTVTISRNSASTSRVGPAHTPIAEPLRATEVASTPSTPSGHGLSK